MEDYARVISNNVRFGYGRKVLSDRVLYYAWYGYPNRNDDYIIITKITEEEFNKIEKDYPQEISATTKEATIFEEEYIDNHKVIIEGWNISISRAYDMNYIKRKALDILNEKNPDIKEIPDIFGIDENLKYYHMVIDYPNKRYKQVLNIESAEDFIKYIVRETIYEKRQK